MSEGKIVFDKISLLEGSCNTYFIDDKVKVLVDAGFDFKGKVDVIVLTHCHKDHIKFLKNIMTLNPKAVVYLDIKDLLLIEGAGFVIDDRFKALYEGKTKIETGKYVFEVIEVSAHTKGSVALWDEKNKVLFSGDTIFEDGVGRTDFPESIPDNMALVEPMLLGLDSEIILPGHGETFKPESVNESVLDEEPKSKKKAKK